ncbi:TetR/AcrR family transcriptional regulator [Cellulosimicrobium cellulans]|uniref:TetR/AcrR family transcriptional regulator n=1 Tax=Cellulosimicrobium cellulans TaxID=1710 RepID=UPI00196442FF|nr:TetR family transcriptional regulator C-terminal domain-containing protein [Cellulosimicrobium cellulans]MBN0042269.1 TetR/AcrR family transcriptional regulator [Cellulosimicrobium cellulans]
MPRPKVISDEAILVEVLHLVQRIGPERFTLAAAGKQTGLSPSTLVQRFGSKRALLLAADRWAVERWVGGMDAVPETGPALDRLIAGMMYTVDPETTAEEMANSVSLLQIGLADSEFHASTKDGAVRLRTKILERLREAAANAEIKPDVDLDGLAELIEITYHGAMIRWAVHRDGQLVRSMEAAFTRLLRPYRA